MIDEDRTRVGTLRPSQLLYTYGVGAIVDLPKISAMVMGLDDWNTKDCKDIREPRLLKAVQERLGTQVQQLLSPPLPEDDDSVYRGAFDPRTTIGVPVAPFPRWMRCPYCDFLAPINSGLFKLERNLFRPDRTQYVHENCNKPGRAPSVVPARFLVACERGHLDDFPWVEFVHKEGPCSSPILRLKEYGVSGSAADVEIRCDTCKASRRMSEAFGEKAREHNMPGCRGRRPHLRDFEEDGCPEKMKAILLGASNSWFPIALPLLSIPSSASKLEQLVDEQWDILGRATSKDILTAFREIGQLGELDDFSIDEVWSAVAARRESAKEGEDENSSDLKGPEWRVFIDPKPAYETKDFRLTPVMAPGRFSHVISKVVLVDRLREVRALVGFTRIESPWDYEDMASIPEDRQMTLSRKAPEWVPGAEVRGEGIFIQFDEEQVQNWCVQPAVVNRQREFFTSHKQWRTLRNITPREAGFPGIRYVMLHSFAHALMRQLTLECGYASASVRERIYSRAPEEDGGPMAGILLYTAAPDSEGTLGGLVSLGQPKFLERHIIHALEQMRLCASDPLCAEHSPPADGKALHGAACHACLFAPETSCELGNKYIDRNVLVSTFSQEGMGFFSE